MSIQHIILVRHAKAFDRIKAAAIAMDDCDRPLIKSGIKKLKENIVRNKNLFKNVDVYASSDYLRALQTMDVLLAQIKTKRLVKKLILPEITPEDDPQKLIQWLNKNKGKKTVIVSHEPFISNFLKSYLKNVKIDINIKKSCFIELQIRQSQVLLLAFYYA